MDAKAYLKDYSIELEKYKTGFFKGKIKDANKIDPVAAEALVRLEEYMRGGKSVRAALVALGYKLAGGKNLKNILGPSLAVELMHNALVIHDDFIDKDEMRRGKPTVHKTYAKKHGDHYGASMAIIVGDIGIFLANRLIAESNFKKEIVSKAEVVFNMLLLNTGYGELMDIDFDYRDKIKWEEVLKVRIYKTAHYTFVMPLLVGAILAGGDKKLTDLLKKYGEPVGLAFQLRDDYLGIYGDSAETGKSNDSDIREGKKTLLYLQALKKAKSGDLKYLKNWYGSKKIDNSKIKKIREIIRESGAVEDTQKASLDFVKKGKSYISKITKNQDLSSTLISLADYMVERDK